MVLPKTPSELGARNRGKKTAENRITIYQGFVGKKMFDRGKSPKPPALTFPHSNFQKMMVDMDGLAKAEKELQELQSKLQQRDSELELLPKGKRSLLKDQENKHLK